MTSPSKAEGATSPAPGIRPRRPRGSLTVESILEAAEQVASAGFASLSVRAVASQLQASPMALYRYFATMDELVDALLDRVLGRFEPAPPTDDWLADLRTFATNHRRLLTQHPWAISALFAHPNPGLNAVRIGENALRILRDGAIVGDPAVATFSGILSLNYGWSAFATSRDDASHAGASGPTMRNALASLPPDHYPLTVEVADQMASYGSDEHYDRVLGQLLAGVRADGTHSASDS